MQGVIRGREVVSHPVIIIRAFGLRVFWRCIMHAVRRDGATFLGVVAGQA